MALSLHSREIHNTRTFSPSGNEIKISDIELQQRTPDSKESVFSTSCILTAERQTPRRYELIENSRDNSDEEDTSSSNELPLSSSVADQIHSILTFSKTQRTQACKVMNIGAKLSLGAICFTASLGGLEPAKRNFSNKALQDIFAYGNAFAWGSLSTYCITSIYNSIVRDKPKLNVDKSLRDLSMYWSGVFALGILTELPSIYTTWYYNSDKPFLYIYCPIVNSFFSALSAHEFLQVLSHPDSFLKTRNLSPNELDTITARKTFCQLLHSCKESLQQEPNLDLENKVNDLSNNVNRAEAIGDTIFEALKIGLEHSKSNALTDSEYVSRTRAYMKIASSFLPLGSPILDGILIYKGCRGVFDSKIPIPFIIALAVLPGVYLQVKLTQDFYDDLLTKSSSLAQSRPCENQVNCNSAIRKVLKGGAILSLTIMGLSGDTTVARDNVGFDNIIGLIIGISVVSTMAILLFSSMNNIATDLINFYESRHYTTQQKLSRNLSQRIGYLEEYFNQTTKEEFVQSLKDIKLESRVLPFQKMQVLQDSST